MATFTVESEVTITISADVELDNGELCGAPQAIRLCGATIARGSIIYDNLLPQVQQDLIAEALIECEHEDIIRKCREWGGSV